MICRICGGSVSKASLKEYHDSCLVKLVGRVPKQPLSPLDLDSDAPTDPNESSKEFSISGLMGSCR